MQHPMLLFFPPGMQH